jgi:hypothetical protein
MPDGKRKRRFSDNSTKRRWYALFRSLRFRRRFAGTVPADSQSPAEAFDIRKTWVVKHLNHAA